MLRISWTLALAVAAMTVVLLGAGRATADDPMYLPGVPYYSAPPAVAYYGPPPLYRPLQRLSYYYAPPVVYGAAPQVSYYYAPPVVYGAAPQVSYYYAPPAVSYYAPSVSYYAAPAAAVTTTRYGLFGRPWVSTAYYYPR
jgi:hypothetical protein